MREAACLNCGTPLAGRFCHDCGQGGEVHRSVLHLGAELLETVTHADSRFWRTMRRLALDPARLSRDYIEGRRAREIPPLRLFFVMLFLLFGIGSLTGGTIDVGPLNPAQHRTVEQKLDSLTINGYPHATRWLRTRLERAADHPDQVLAVARDWSERFAILMLPVAALMLWVLYLPQRRVLYDHVIVSIHSLCFACLVLVTFFLIDTVASTVSAWILLLLPVHLFAHLRGVYGTSGVGTLLRMAVLAFATSVAVAALLLALAAVGLVLGTRG